MARIRVKTPTAQEFPHVFVQVAEDGAGIALLLGELVTEDFQILFRSPAAILPLALEGSHTGSDRWFQSGLGRPLQARQGGVDPLQIVLLHPDLRTQPIHGPRLFGQGLEGRHQGLGNLQHLDLPIQGLVCVRGIEADTAHRQGDEVVPGHRQGLLRLCDLRLHSSALPLLGRFEALLQGLELLSLALDGRQGLGQLVGDLLQLPIVYLDRWRRLGSEGELQGRRQHDDAEQERPHRDRGRGNISGLSWWAGVAEGYAGLPELAPQTKGPERVLGS